MANFIKTISIKNRLLFLAGLSVTGFFIFGFLSYSTLNQFKVNGPLYKRIMQRKFHIGDDLPPSEYIIDTYLISLHLRDKTNPQSIAFLIENAKRLKGEYDT